MRLAALARLTVTAGRFVLSLAREATGVAGVGSVAYGAWLAWHPAGFIVGGLLATAAAYLWARTG